MTKNNHRMTDPKLNQIAHTLTDKTFPKIFAVELCADCNLQCAMCHHGSMQRPKGTMPLALFKRCAAEIAEVAPQTDVWFSFCGEPLLQPDRLFEMLDHGASVGLKSLNLNTNGVELTRSVAERIMTSTLSVVVIGVDGFKKDTYEGIRIGADRDKVYANVEYLLALRKARQTGPEVMVQFIEMPENADEMDEFRAYWLERGATVKMRNQLSWGGQIEAKKNPQTENRIPCPWAVTMMHVFWDGRVPRCPGDTEGDEGVGNAWDESLTDLWAQLGQYRSLHLDHKFDDLPDRCSTCTDWMVGASVKIRPSHRTDKAQSEAVT